MSKILIKPNGFLGDIVFASSIARKLKEESQFDEVDFVTGFVQATSFLSYNRWINNTWLVPPTSTPLFGVKVGGYEKQIELGFVEKIIPPPMQFQIEAGVKNPDTKFELWTDSTWDEIVLNKYGSKEYIAVMNPDLWHVRSYLFTPEQYKLGVDVPNKGYGGKHRDTTYILKELSKNFNIVLVGEVGNLVDLAVKPIMKTFSILKHAKYFVGTEGGLANFAAGLGTKTVLTGDFVHQLYGWNGVVKKVTDPKLGPRHYFPETIHIDLNPYYSDNQVADEIIEIVSENKNNKDYTYEWVYPS